MLQIIQVEEGVYCRFAEFQLPFATISWTRQTISPNGDMIVWRSLRHDRQKAGKACRVDYWR
jgi:hypothetical protein